MLISDLAWIRDPKPIKVPDTASIAFLGLASVMMTRLVRPLRGTICSETGLSPSHAMSSVSGDAHPSVRAPHAGLLVMRLRQNTGLSCLRSLLCRLCKAPRNQSSKPTAPFIWMLLPLLVASSNNAVSTAAPGRCT